MEAQEADHKAFIAAKIEEQNTAIAAKQNELATQYQQQLARNDEVHKQALSRLGNELEDARSDKRILLLRLEQTVEKHSAALHA